MLSNNPNQKTIQQNFFASPLVHIINPKHELIKLSEDLDWNSLSNSFKKYYSDKGAPAKPIRLMASLLMLKSMYNISDEKLIDAWIQNPYYQYFSGETHFQWKQPCDPSDLVYFRKRIGESGCEEILKMTVNLFSQELEKEEEVIIDTTCMEKNITFPTDSSLKLKIIEKCKKIGQKEGVKWRQTYTRILQKCRQNLRWIGHPKNAKKGRKAIKMIHTIASVFVRELKRKLVFEKQKLYQVDLEVFEKILLQERKSKDKIYSLHEPDVFCIAKGKKHKKYEFGCKISVSKTLKSGIIVGVKYFEGNPYDGKTLESALVQSRQMLDKEIKVAIVDRGYRGRKKIGNTEICFPNVLGDRNLSTYEKRKKQIRCRKRSGVEPVIGHLKSDHRMNRNFLKGKLGDQINALMAGAGFNLNKHLKRLKNRFLSFFESLFSALFFPFFLNYVSK